jgi:hypothetical protein
MGGTRSSLGTAVATSARGGGELPAALVRHAANLGRLGSAQSNSNRMGARPSVVSTSPIHPPHTSARPRTPLQQLNPEPSPPWAWPEVTSVGLPRLGGTEGPSETSPASSAGSRSPTSAGTTRLTSPSPSVATSRASTGSRRPTLGTGTGTQSAERQHDSDPSSHSSDRRATSRCRRTLPPGELSPHPTCLASYRAPVQDVPFQEQHVEPPARGVRKRGNCRHLRR